MKQLKNERKYNFMDNLPEIKNEKKWRTCLYELAGDCEKKIFGYKENRICQKCSRSDLYHSLINEEPRKK